MAEFTLSSEQIAQLVEKAFAAGFNSRPFYLDWPDHAQAFMDWCDLESERMRIHPGTVPVHGWIEGR